MYYEIAGTKMRIIGSIHMFPGAPAPLPSWVEDAYAWAEDLIVESEPNPATFRPYTRLPAGDALSKHLSPLIFSSVCTMWAGAVTPAEIEQMKPWVPWLGMIGRLMPLSPGVENLLLPRARSDGKSIIELETVGEVPAMLDAIPDSTIEAALAFNFSDLPRACRAFTETYAAWVRRDAGAILRNARAQPSFHGPLGDALVRQRNDNWLPRLVPHLKSARRTLVVVGAVHLVGPRNLLDGLASASGSTYSALP